jgi:hypothetical protein
MKKMILLFMIFILPTPCLADETLQLVTTIPINHASTRITSITPIGDFNGDGYGDLAIGLGSIGYSPVFETVYLYYGGPAFDSIPDLRFFSDPQNTSICGLPNYLNTAFGEIVTPLGDFNGDGYDDFAISAYGLCTFNYHVGRIYIYFGGPNPDTIPDLRIDGIGGYDGMGFLMASGDFNGDGLGDLIARAGDEYYGERMCIFFGNDPPDTSLDWVRSFPPSDYTISRVHAGFDPNGDGYEDFSWSYSRRDSSFVFFLGGDTLSHEPIIWGNPYNFLDFDMSSDGIDDFCGSGPTNGTYLFLGGNPLNLEPDYPLGSFGAYPFIYHRTNHADMLVADDIRVSGIHRFIMYSLGIPPDTIPLGYLYYDSSRFPTSPDIGDINGDGNGELALGPGSNSAEIIRIYAIVNIDGINDRIGNGQPIVFSLSIYPNPFNSSTTISISGIDKAEIGIYDITGGLIAKLSAENGKAIWNASSFSSGAYFARMIGMSSSHTIRLVLLK